VNDGSTWLDVEVVFAGPLRAVCRTFRVAAPATVADVLGLARSCEEFAGSIGVHEAVGIFGRRVAAEQRVEDGDRIEIYRPLAADPMTARRARARAQPKAPGRGRNGPG
jgi:uncharacterized protein